MKRRLIVGCLGAQQVGKTTLLKWLYGRRMAQRQRVRIVDPNGGLGGQCPDDVDAWLSERLAARDTDTLVLDDLEAYAPRQFSPKTPWMKLAGQNAHYRLNVLWSGHRPQDVAPTLRAMTDVLYLFQLGRGDANQRKALDDIAPGIEIPTAPYTFVEFWPKHVHYGREGEAGPRTGRTLAGGGVEFDPLPRNHSSKASASAKSRSP